ADIEDVIVETVSGYLRRTYRREPAVMAVVVDAWACWSGRSRTAVLPPAALPARGRRPLRVAGGAPARVLVAPGVASRVPFRRGDPCLRPLPPRGLSRVGSAGVLSGIQSEWSQWRRIPTPGTGYRAVTRGARRDGPTDSSLSAPGTGARSTADQRTPPAARSRRRDPGSARAVGRRAPSAAPRRSGRGRCPPAR